MPTVAGVTLPRTSASRSICTDLQLVVDAPVVLLRGQPGTEPDNEVAFLPQCMADGHVDRKRIAPIHDAMTGAKCYHAGPDPGGERANMGAVVLGAGSDGNQGTLRCLDQRRSPLDQGSAGGHRGGSNNRFRSKVDTGFLAPDVNGNLQADGRRPSGQKRRPRRIDLRRGFRALRHPLGVFGQRLEGLKLAVDFVQQPPVPCRWPTTGSVRRSRTPAR